MGNRRMRVCRKPQCDAEIHTGAPKSLQLVVVQRRLPTSNMASKAGSSVFDAKPYWPYTEANGKQLDKDVHLPVPIVEG